MVELTSGDFRKMLVSGAKLLEINRPLVDSLNVFPVPDGDTGTNMSLTFSMAVQELGKLNSNASVAECATAFSKGALKGARGNSGVISSQIFKGFAVVAEQIRSLSEQSAKAAVDTRQLIESAIAVSNEGNEAAERVNTSIEKVINGMKEVADSSQKLSEIAEEQAKAMEQAEAGINQISDVVQSNSASAEETSATSEELSAQAETMNSLISKFILENK